MKLNKLLNESKKELLHLQQAMIDDLEDDFDVSLVKDEKLGDHLLITHAHAKGFKPLQMKLPTGDGAPTDSMPKTAWYIMVISKIGWSKMSYSGIIRLLRMRANDPDWQSAVKPPK